jgi:hypothetical protein
VIIALAKALWQERRLALYQRVQRARVVKSSSEWRGGRNPLADYLGQRDSKKSIIRSDDVAPELPAPAAPSPKSAEEQLLELGNLLSFDQLEKEVEVESKLQAKIDRLLKRFFQIKAMKQIAGLTVSTPAALNGPAPVLELTAQEPT